MLGANLDEAEQGRETHDLGENQALQAALRAPRGSAPSFVKRTHLAKLDTVDLFRPKDDLKFRNDLSVPAGEAGAFEFRAVHLEAMCQEIEADMASGRYDQQTCLTLQHRIDDARKEMRGIIKDKDKSTYAVLLATRVTMPILPVALPALSQPATQWNGLAIIATSYTKTTLQGLAQAINRTAPNGRTFDRFMQRDLANEVQSALLFMNFLKDPASQKIARSLVYNLPVAAAGFVILMTLYNLGSSIRNKKNQWYGPNWLPGEREASDSRLRTLSANTSSEDQAVMLRHAEAAGDLKESIKDFRTLFKVNGGELTDSFNWQVGQQIEAVEKLEKTLLAAGSGGSRPEKVKWKDRPKDADRVQKLIMVPIAAAVLFAPFIPVTGAFLKELVPAPAEAGGGNNTETAALFMSRRSGVDWLHGNHDVPVVQGSGAATADNPADDVASYLDSGVKGRGAGIDSEPTRLGVFGSLQRGLIEELPVDNDEVPDLVGGHVSPSHDHVDNVPRSVNPLARRVAGNSTRLVDKSKFETIPAVDLGIDFCISMVKMTRDAFDHTKDIQDSHDTFSQWVGLSGIMAIVFGAGAKGEKFAQGGKAWIGGAASLNVGNLLLATLVGKTMGYSVSTTGKVAKLFFGRVFGSGAHITAQKFFDCFRSGDTAGSEKALQELGQRMIDRAERAEARRQQRVGGGDESESVRVRDLLMHGPHDADDLQEHRAPDITPVDDGKTGGTPTETGKSATEAPMTDPEIIAEGSPARPPVITHGATDA